MSQPRAARYESPWQRLPWTGPLAIVAWALALWAMSIFMSRAPATLERAAPISARFIELPKPPAPLVITPPPVIRPDPPPAKRARERPVKRVVAAPAAVAAQSAEQPAEPLTAPSTEPVAPNLPHSSGLPLQDASSSSGLPAQGIAPGAAGLSSGMARAGRHPGATVRAAAVGVINPPLGLSISNEENIFDNDGLVDHHSSIFG